MLRSSASQRKCNIFSNDDFVGGSSMKITSPDESFDCISVSTRRSKCSETDQQIHRLHRHVHQEREGDVRIEFHAGEPKRTEQKISVQDQLPVSQNEKIVVEQIEPTKGSSPG